MPRLAHDRTNAVALWFFPVVAALVLILSLPRFVEGILALPGNAAIEALRVGPAGSESIDSLVRSREMALAMVDRGRHRSELTSGLVLQARLRRGDERSRTLDRAVREAERAVMRAPADAYAWFHLAEASFARDGVGQRAVDAVFSSIATGPYETDLLVPRLDILFAARSYLSHDSVETIDNQARAAWTRRPIDLTRAIRRHGAADIVRRGLEREPSMAQFFDATLRDPSIR
jgi:hypothetical protein